MINILIFRKYKENESEEVINLLIRAGIKDLNLNDLIYVIVEDNFIKGACKIDNDGENGLLKYIVVEEKSRGQNLGEGLLRSTLNKLDKDGIETVYYKELDPYLLKKGFLKTNDNNLELNISDFFGIGCKCSGPSNEI